MSKGITAHIWSNGDADAGIKGCETNVNTCLIEFNDNEHRTAVRRELERCFTQLWEEKTKVLFDDEFGSE